MAAHKYRAIYNASAGAIALALHRQTFLCTQPEPYRYCLCTSTRAPMLNSRAVGIGALAMERLCDKGAGRNRRWDRFRSLMACAVRAGVHFSACGKRLQYLYDLGAPEKYTVYAEVMDPLTHKMVTHEYSAVHNASLGAVGVWRSGWRKILPE